MSDFQPAVAGSVFLGLGANVAATAETPSPAVACKGADQDKVAVSIDNRPPRFYGSAAIGGLPHTSIVVEGQGGRSRKFAGVALCDLLESAGMNLGGVQRPAALTTYLWVAGSDGFRVLISGAEVHRFIGAGEVLLADSEDGRAIPNTDGPYRLVVVGDKVHAHWMRQVRAPQVIQAAPPPNSSK